MAGDGSLGAIQALSAEEVAARLSGPPEQRVALVRVAAEGGLAEAQLVWGQMLLDGRDVAADPCAAFLSFLRAAQQGHALAINMVGRCYDLGWGTAIDKRRAAEWFRAAAERGLDWGLYNYATALALGEGVAQDRAAALALFERAAAMGNAKAMNFVGSFHEDGWAVPRDAATAATWYARAAAGGDFRGLFNHARMLAAEGRMEEAADWLGRVPETATPAFLAKAAEWLGDSPDPALRGLASLLDPDAIASQYSLR